MSDELRVKNAVIRLAKGDITDMEIESFVYYAQHDLALGSGFGTAIAMRGGPSIQEELKQYGTLETTGVVISSAGSMKAEHIIHAVGPRFQEHDLESKLRTTIINCLTLADEKGIKSIAFPAMGVGFYGVPLGVSAEITLGTILEYLSGQTGIDEVVISLLDNREYQPYQKQFSAMSQGVEERT
ncbi:MAG: macro domain-containing protein [Candidatus Zixiibacteriota bacterium]|nr:MAG: macro domain-containing protein [candidate division Zixibacteria bacterium]